MLNSSQENFYGEIAPRINFNTPLSLSLSLSLCEGVLSRKGRRRDNSGNNSGSRSVFIIASLDRRAAPSPSLESYHLQFASMPSLCHRRGRVGFRRVVRLFLLAARGRRKRERNTGQAGAEEGCAERRGAFQHGTAPRLPSLPRGVSVCRGRRRGCTSG